MELFTPEVGLIFWMLIAFGIVFFILAKYAWPAIIKGVEERKAFIDNSLAAAKAANERLAGIQEESERILKQTRDQELQLLKDARDMQSKIIADAKNQAAVEAEKLITEAKAAIEKEKDTAIRDIQNRIADLSLNIAEKILRKNLDNPPAQQELVQKLIKEAQKN
jgi:F-type H+-transporting ATPase subunit b